MFLICPMIQHDLFDAIKASYLSLQGITSLELIHVPLWESDADESNSAADVALSVDELDFDAYGLDENDSNDREKAWVIVTEWLRFYVDYPVQFVEELGALCPFLKEVVIYVGDALLEFTFKIETRRMGEGHKSTVTWSISKPSGMCLSFIITPFECPQVESHRLVRSRSWWRSCIQSRSMSFNALQLTGCLSFSRYKAVDSGSLPNFAGPTHNIQWENIATYLQSLHLDNKISYIAQLSWMHHHPGFGNRQLPIPIRTNNYLHTRAPQRHFSSCTSGPCSSCGTT